jgi:hypothetical protein
VSVMEGLDEFGKRYGFDDWREPKGGEALFIWRFALGGQELPGYNALRIDTVEHADLPRKIESLWRTGKKGADRVLLRVDASEASSVPKARAELLRLLAQFQSPEIERIGDGPGDIAFGGAGYRALVFASANIVVLMLNAGDEIQSVEPPARDLDRLLREGPGADRSSVRPTIQRAEVESASGGRQVRLVLEAEDPLGRHVWFRLSAPGGEFVAQEDGVVFRPEGEGRQAIEVTAVNENLGVAVEQIDFTI